MTPTHRLHTKFTYYWPQYERQDLTMVCKGIITLMGKQVKGDGISQVRKYWSQVCEFLIKWEGR